MSSPSYSLFDISSRHSNFRARPTASALLALQQSQQQQQQHIRAGLTRANAIPRKRRTIKDEVMAFADRQSRGPPKYPAYLKDTVYATLVHEQYALYRSQFTKQQTNRQRHEPLFAIDKLAPDSIITALISHDLRLPTAWNPADKGEYVDISADCMELTYKGNSTMDIHLHPLLSCFSRL
ncbi:hypothetical protein BX666DRAFT_1032271 [Dichotomocladium elegans]|nr:hypothetical protein BX666DRAFT_1032271 [Dichotomocladium elegans]